MREMMDRSPSLTVIAHHLGLMGEPPQVVHASGGDNFGFFEIYRAQPKPVWSEAWRATEELLVATRDLASANGARFAVVVIPAAWEVYPHKWEQALRKLPLMRGASLDLDEPAKRLSAFLGKHGVPVITLLPEFRSRAPTSQPLYFDNDGHWTAAGHRLAADLVAERVSALLTTKGRPASVEYGSIDHEQIKQ
jgi:hypothetical protein